ncbi:pseudaminic acid synthase [Thermodesulfobacteriota bacterium]
MNSIKINNRSIGNDHQAYIIAEMSANHSQDYDRAVKILEAAKKAGADAIKLQTYTPDTLTIDCDNEYFKISDTIWRGKTLYDLYGEAYTPWEWHRDLKDVADGLGLDFFSTAFDSTAVEFLDKIGVPAFKIASFENIDMLLLKEVACTGKPIIISTGMASFEEISDAVNTVRENGNNQIALLKCTSAYPAIPAEANLKTIPHMAEAFNTPVGLSDHTTGVIMPAVAVTLGACIIEKHFTISRKDPGPDSTFSLEPEEFKNMVEGVRQAEEALGTISYEQTEKEKESSVFRRSLFVVKDIKRGESLTEENVRAIRPGYGLLPKYLDKVLGCRAACDIKRGTPIKWDQLMGSDNDSNN